MRKGGASFVTWVTGEALFAVSSLSFGSPPSNLLIGPRAPPGLGLILKKLTKSLGPQKSTTQRTRLDSPDEPLSPSNSFTPADVPSMATRWPPADEPQTPMRSGSRLYFFALARIHRMAALQSWICPGQVVTFVSR